MYALARPLLFRLAPETAHTLTFNALRLGGPVARGLARLAWGPPDPRLATTIAGLPLAGPVGLAAGLDKDGTVPRFWPQIGFGFVELGTVTALAQPGNPKPRLFRFPDAQALINRMGFNNHGSQSLARRLGALREAGKLGPTPIGVNIGKSKVTPLEDAVSDYVTSTRRVAAIADYLVINVSSPNTPGLRKLQNADALMAIVEAVVGEAGATPVFVKLAPDLAHGELDDAIRVAEEGGAAGIIATNTTIRRYGLPDVGAGGLSGRPLTRQALEIVRYVAPRTRLPVVAVGGIGSVEDVCAALAAGAHAVQLYTALIFEGPGLVQRLNKGLVAKMEAAGVQDFNGLRQHLQSNSGVGRPAAPDGASLGNVTPIRARSGA